MAAHEEKSFADALLALSAALEQAFKMTSSLRELHGAEMHSAVSEARKDQQWRHEAIMLQHGSALPNQILGLEAEGQKETDGCNDNPGSMIASPQEGCAVVKDTAMLLSKISAGEQGSSLPKSDQPDTAPILAVVPQEPLTADKRKQFPSKLSTKMRSIWEDAVEESVSLLTSRCCVRVVRHDDDATQKMSRNRPNGSSIISSALFHPASTPATPAAQARGHGIHNLFCRVLNPVGPARFVWNSMCLFFILYDLFMVPLQAFKLEDIMVLEAFQWGLAVWWTLDVYMTFRTGYIDGSCVEMRPSKIAYRYARTWLVCDCAIVLVEWVNCFVGMFASASVLRSSRALRFFRYLKLFRVGKLQNFWKSLRDQVNSNVTLLCISLMILGGILLLTIHIASCIWYWIGDTQVDGWTTYDDYKGDKSTFFWYAASFRWAVAQFNGRTDIDERRNMMERWFTCIVGVSLALIAQAVIIAFLTKLMMELSEVVSERTSRRRALNDFLEANPLPPVLTMQVKRCLYDYQDVDQELRREDQVLALLPKHLQGDVLEEVRAPVLAQHPFFQALLFESPFVLRLVCCKVVQTLPASKEEVVFDKGDPCERMLFTDKLTAYYGKPADAGHSKILLNHHSSHFWERTRSTQRFPSGTELLERTRHTRPKKIPMGSWISEAALWVEWRNQGRLVSQGHGFVLAATASKLALMLKTFPDRFTLAHLHAKNVAWELRNQDPDELSDVLSFEVQVHNPLHVTITVLSATGLRNADSCAAGGKSDPYCVCKLIGVTGKADEVRFQTKVVDNTLDPVWNHAEDICLSWHQHIEFQIRDHDFLKRDEELGVARMSPEEFEHGFEGDLPLKSSNGGPAQGCVKVKIQVKHTLESPVLRLPSYAQKKRKVSRS